MQRKMSLWPFVMASFAALRKSGTLSVQQPTWGDAGALEWIQSKLTRLGHRPASRVAVAKPGNGDVPGSGLPQGRPIGWAMKNYAPLWLERLLTGRLVCGTKLTPLLLNAL